MNKITIWPHTSQFEVDADRRYQDWLRNDHARERAYRKAIDDLANLDINTILDAGTGTGVWAIALASVFPNSEIDGIDIQEANIENARRNAQGFPSLGNRLKFITADINSYRPSTKYDLIITELDGGVGNNEGAKRAFRNLQKLVAPRGLIIPSKIETYVAPVDLSELNQHLPNTEANPFLQSRGIKIQDPYSCYYLVYGASSSCFLSEPQLLDSIDTTGKIEEGYKKKLDFQEANRGNLTGFLIWFNHQLTQNVTLTNHPDQPVTSWGQAYFPVHQTKITARDSIQLFFEECITQLGPLPHYDWEVHRNCSVVGSYSNKENQKRRT